MGRARACETRFGGRKSIVGPWRWGPVIQRRVRPPDVVLLLLFCGLPSTSRKLLHSGIRFSAPCYNFHNTRFSQEFPGSKVITPVIRKKKIS